MMELESILKQVQEKRNLKKKKWSYMIFPIIQEKRSAGHSYYDIAKWFEMQSFEISERTVREIYYYFTKNSQTTAAPLVSNQLPDPKIIEENSSVATSDLNKKLAEKMQQKGQKDQLSKLENM